MTITKSLRMLGFSLGNLILFSGCAWTTVDGITPVYPKPGVWVELSATGAATVDSLQPELKWKGEGGSKKYDLAIWNTIRIPNDRYLQPLKIIYQKTALSGTMHKVEIILEPNHQYYWSVRETGAGAWSMLTFHAIGPAGSGSNPHLFRFSTPTRIELEEKAAKMQGQ